MLGAHSQNVFRAQRPETQGAGPLPARDACRAKLQSYKHTTAWMQTVPNKGMGSLIPGCEYRVLLRWWLGFPLVGGGSGSACPFCDSSMDAFGS